MSNKNLLNFLESKKNDPQLKSVQEDHGIDQNPDCEDKVIKKISEYSKAIPNLINTNDQIDRGSKRELEYYYNMNHKNRGLALIFNHEKYDNNNMSSRDGTHVDCDRLRETLRSLDFDVRIYDDLKLNDILYNLEKGMYITQNQL